jgi:hypothetical protein
MSVPLFLSLDGEDRGGEGGGAEFMDLDELFEEKRQQDLHQLELCQRMLTRVHTRIRVVSRQKNNTKSCWFVVPPHLLGIPRFDQAGCLAFLTRALEDNGLVVRYVHPHTLFISWAHFVPTFVRDEVFKQTGVRLNERGQPIAPKTPLAASLASSRAPPPSSTPPPPSHLTSLWASIPSAPTPAPPARPPPPAKKPTVPITYRPISDYRSSRSL